MASSDPDLLRVFVDFLRTELDVTAQSITMRCNLVADHLGRQREIEQFWLGRLRLPPSSLRTSHVSVQSKHSQKKRKNKLPYGTCTEQVGSTQLVQTIYGPEWLD